MFAGFLLAARAERPDDQFIVAYNLIQQADRASDPREGTKLYEAAQETLRQLQKANPSWNDRVVTYRLRYCAEKVAALAEAVAKNPAPPTNAGKTNGPVTNPAAPSSEVLAQFNELNTRIQQMAGEKQVLEAKLREALVAQPAPVDPRELQDAVEKISALQTTNKTLVAKLEAQEKERRNLVDKVVAEEANRALSETRKQLDEQKQSLARIQKERGEVEAKLAKLQDDTVRPLKLENQTLKQQVTELKSDTDRGRQVAELSARLTRLQTDLGEVRTRNEKLTSEKNALEKQVEEMKTRQAEEGIVRISKLQADLAVARAEADRNTIRAADLAVSLEKEQRARAGLETENKSLSERVSQLAARTAADTEAIGLLQAALTAEKSERARAEAQLKAAEERVKTAGTAPVAGSAGDAAVQVAAAKAEVARLQEVMRESARHETELQAALAQESALRGRLQKEKADLERRLAASDAALKAKPKAEPAVTKALEARVRALEKERGELEEKLARLSQQARTRLMGLRTFPASTPRERAMEFRLLRQ